ncbi:MAG: hypothetical protein AB7E28_03725 [Desulfurella sp.]|jgi:hypothetical protein
MKPIISEKVLGKKPWLSYIPRSLNKIEKKLLEQTETVGGNL